MSVLEIKGLSKVKTIGSAIGMPEHIFYLGDSQVKLLNLTDARIEVSLRVKSPAQNTLKAGVTDGIETSIYGSWGELISISICIKLR